MKINFLIFLSVREILNFNKQSVEEYMFKNLCIEFDANKTNLIFEGKGSINC